MIRSVMEDGKPRLEVQCGGDTCLSFPEMSLKMPGCVQVKIATCGERVEVSTPFVTAVADSVCAGMGRPFIQLEGHVKLTYHAKDREGTTSADKACIHLTEGNMTINLEVIAKSDE
jgi:hypothetical protein